ncbi:MAG: DNA repair protein RadC [Bacteroidia bacterium]|nr:DNA repair protein RadC [Bacteroidia bacterium]MBT8269563.1 DNA repair protein RadC [Bacteroidia bacterium]NNF83151.1 DNA repair protein RadC [Flavobacteriaceae bacterium]NNK71142.1 DNA repair protein RadC [Flavobacteriaceae bacterium]NNL79413.1 DNA repair protein RadC [Flavobacteriaceae bacterium]
MSSGKHSISIKKWAPDDRPREKLLRAGPRALSSSELLALLIGSGTRHISAVELSKRILADVDHSLQDLGKLTPSELMKFEGIGQAKAVVIAAAIELGKRRNSENSALSVQVKSSQQVFEIMQPLIGELNHEEFWILYLNNSNRVIYKLQLSKGGITGTLVDVRLVLKNALERHATALILAHNHPSGTLKPSEADKQLTRKLQIACSSLDLKVLDHVIVTEKAYFSFADEAML